MEIRKLTAIVKNPRTTAKWIEEQIANTSAGGDIERLCVLATSSKLTPAALDKLWSLCNSAKIALAVAQNPVTTGKYLQCIKYAIVCNSYKWSQEEREKIMEAIRKNPNNDSSIERLLSECSREDNYDDDYDDDHAYDDDEYGDIMELIDFCQGGADNW